MSCHHHPATPAGSGAERRALGVALALSVAVLAAELVGGLVSGSLALLTDAAHVFADVAGLGLALFASILAGRPPTPTRTWGFHRAEVLSAVVQSSVLLVMGAVLAVEAVKRLIAPEPVEPGLMTVFAAIALVGNAAALLVLGRLGGHTLNTRAALLEVAADAAGSAAVLLGAGVIALTGWHRADPVVSLLIAAAIAPRSLRLLRESVTVLLEATPPGLDLEQVRRHVLGVPHVRDLHDLHATLVATGLPVLTAHVVVDDECFVDGHVPQLLHQVQDCLAGHFDVDHSTLQFETAAHAANEGARHD